MKRSLIAASVAAGALALTGVTIAAAGPTIDFGAWVQAQLRAHSQDLFGFEPLKESAPGPDDGLDNLQAIQVAPGLTVSLVSSSTASAADQIALWPDDNHPRYLFVCDEETSNPAVQRVDLSAPPSANATTIVTGLSSCDPVRRTPWGTIIMAEEAGATGGRADRLHLPRVGGRGVRQHPASCRERCARIRQPRRASQDLRVQGQAARPRRRRPVICRAMFASVAASFLHDATMNTRATEAPNNKGFRVLRVLHAIVKKECGDYHEPAERLSILDA